MNEEALNMSLRKFLKKVGVTSQREIESAVRAASDGKDLPDTLNAKVILTVDGVDLNVTIDGTLDLKG